MGTSRSFGELALKMNNAARGIQPAAKKAVGAAALATTTLIRSEIDRATGGDKKLSGVGRRNGRPGGARVNARYDVKGTGNPTALVRAVGPLQLVENNTKPHDVAPTKQRRRKNPKAALKIGGGQAVGGTYTRKAHVGGSKGKHPFAKGVAKGAAITPRIFDKEIQAHLRRTFR